MLYFHEFSTGAGDVLEVQRRIVSVRSKSINSAPCSVYKGGSKS